MTVSQQTKFTVVDLVSQASAVATHVRGWSTDQILSWLGEHGAVRSAVTMDRVTYLFSSRAGIETVFLLDGDQFTFILDNTTFRPK